MKYLYLERFIKTFDNFKSAEFHRYEDGVGEAIIVFGEYPISIEFKTFSLMDKFEKDLVAFLTSPETVLEIKTGYSKGNLPKKVYPAAGQRKVYEEDYDLI